METQHQPRRYRRGDTSPERPGLVFYTYHLGEEYWTTPEKLAQFRKRDSANARKARKENPEAHKMAFAKWLAKPGKLELKQEVYRKWHAKNPEKRRVITRRYVATVNGTICNRVRSRIAVALKRGDTKSARTMELIGCTIQTLRAHLENYFKPGMSWDNVGDWEIDHVLPLAMFDLSDPEQQKTAFNWRNQRPEWKKDNRLKSDFVKINGKHIRARDARKNIIPFKEAA